MKSEAFELKRKKERRYRLTITNNAKIWLNRLIMRNNASYDYFLTPAPSLKIQGGTNRAITDGNRDEVQISGVKEDSITNDSMYIFLFLTNEEVDA